MTTASRLRASHQVGALVLVLVIALSLVRLIGGWPFSQTMQAAPSGVDAASPPSAATAAGDDVRMAPPSRVSHGSQDDRTSTTTRGTLTLVLTGTLATNDPATGVAIVGESPQSTRRYAVGEPVGPDTRLHAVYSDRVILDHAGVLETLTLASTSSPPPVGYGGAAPAAASRIATLADVVRPQPVFAKGVQRGYRFYPTGDAQAFAALGLQHGDLVVSINGVPLDDPQGSMAMFNSILSSYGVNVTVERGGQTHVITLGATPPNNAVLPGPPP